MRDARREKPHRSRAYFAMYADIRAIRSSPREISSVSPVRAGERLYFLAGHARRVAKCARSHPRGRYVIRGLVEVAPINLASPGYYLTHRHFDAR